MAAAFLVCLLVVTRNREHLWFSLTAFAVLAAVAAGQTRLRFAPAVAGVCWLFFDGFIVHHAGDLAWGQTDRLSLAILLSVAMASGGSAALVRALRRPRRGAAPDCFPVRETSATHENS
ncbi:DUF4118 domain-containing protein [Streptomyces sp. RB6PN25]|uniref:DUF4118 domain-containing protein n=1 Tax=Streptomyces humicola TaxID=2953240 RepID=A0ABT1PX14_9ACTN|nr:DUF4118 domain-containing protein [Streptomyces humicola]MCQ4082179.1 DUF4118 domain-containing protein [Streptomyces humicola]